MAASDVRIVDTTLREGEQFARADFSTEDKVEIARGLTAFGVHVIELTSPVVSPRSAADCRLIAGLGLRSRIAAHVRCVTEDALAAVDCGIGGLHLYMAASPQLRSHSHGRSIDEIVRQAATVAEAVRREAPSIEIRFSSEDSFRTPLADLLRLYLPLASTGLFDRFGVADTVGMATPFQVIERVRLLWDALGMPLEFHGHNDTGLAIANTHAAVAGGASHADTTILGIGERNGIASLEGLVARLYADDPEMVRRQYDLPVLSELAALVARKLDMDVPFNHCIVGEAAFTHKAGVHAKAVLSDPRSYEILDPSHFGLNRRVMTAHRLAGWHAVRARALSLKLNLDEQTLRRAAAIIKEMADARPLAEQEIDAVLAGFGAPAIAGSPA